MQNVLAYLACKEPIEKYASTICAFHLHRTYGEICEMCWHISLPGNANTQAQFACFTHTEHIEKYMNCVGIFHTHGILREIRKLYWRISFILNKLRNMQIACFGIFYSHGIHREICEHECHIPLPKHLWKNCPKIPSHTCRRSSDDLPILQSTTKKKKSTHPT